MKSVKPHLSEYQLSNHFFSGLLLLCCCLLSQGISAQVSGTVFRDFNADGMQGTAVPNLEPGVGGITVKAYNTSNSEVSVTTGPNGSYMFTGLTLPLRIEFSGLASGDFSGPAGSTAPTSVQFYSAATTTANYGINFPFDYCQADPYIATTCYVAGNMTWDASPGNPAGNLDVVPRLNYISGTTSQNNNTGVEMASVTALATGFQIGPTWGLAYARSTGTLYVSAFYKMGSEWPSRTAGNTTDLGKIYKITGANTASPSAPTALTTLTAGTVPYGQMNGGNPWVEYTNDSWVNGVGRNAFGDIDISTDDQFLYAWNLFDKKLYKINANTGATVNSYSMPTVANCAAADLIPGAVKFRAKTQTVLVGLTCACGTNGSPNIYVYEFAPGTGTFTEVLPSVAMNYDRIRVGGAGNTGTLGGVNNWNCWTTTFDFSNPNNTATPPHNDGGLAFYPQPWLLDIELDEEDYMILGISDRFGHQAGPGLAVGGLNGAYGAGDILIAAPNGSNWVIENNGTVGTRVNGTTNFRGPIDKGIGGEEFFYHDRFGVFADGTDDNGQIAHSEIANGGLLLVPGHGEVIVNAYNPAPLQDGNNFGSGGLLYLSTADGSRTRSTRLYTRSQWQLFGKANGFGDLESFCNLPPLEIGNRVWSDPDNDGIQDPGESGIPDVTIQLYASNGTTLLGTTMTDGSGNWYFNTANVADGNTTLAGNQAGPQPGTTYIIRVGSADWTGGAGVGELAGYSLTGGTNEALGTQPDVHDNDAALVSMVPEITYTTGTIGENNHTLDMGFRLPVACSLTAAGETLEMCNNNGTTADATDDYITFSLNPTGTGLGATYTVSANNGGTVTPTSGTYGAATAFQLQNGSANGTLYTITITDVSGGTCTVTTTVQQNACSTPPPPCSLTAAGETLETCNNNSTAADATDDYITFSLNPMGTGIGATYTVSANNGGTVTPASGTYGAATAFQLQNGSANGTLYTITITDVSGGTCTVTTTVQQNACSTPCIQPTAHYIPLRGGCNGITPLDNGSILLTAVTNGDRYAISIGGTYSGTATYATATAVGALPATIQSGVSNAGATYTLRIFNGNDACFQDFVIVVPPADCPMYPSGFIYCEETGQIITGGTISITATPPGATYTIVMDGSTGQYQFCTDGTPGTYTFAYTPPAGYMLSTTRLPGASYNPDPALPNPDMLGAGSTNGLFMDDFTAGANPYYFTFTFDLGDPEVFLNNIPLKGCCVQPVLVVSDAQICSGGSIDLATLVTNAGGGTLSYHLTWDDARNDANALGALTVAPTSAKSYYVRSETSANCYTVREITITMKPAVCGAITVNGPN